MRPFFIRLGLGCLILYLIYLIVEYPEKLNKYSTLLSAIAAFFTALVALYLGDWKWRLTKPRLKLCFDEHRSYPYFHKLAFERYDLPIDFGGRPIYIFRPGFNARVKIINDGKTIARKVQAKVEKIEFYRENTMVRPPRYYHPTTVKWSGEPGWNPVDILPKSYFFMDLFWAKNETFSEIFSFNNAKYRQEIKKEVLEEIITKHINPSGEVYWNVWIDTSFDRGVPKKYDFEGDIVIYFIISGENCDPLRFKAIINWSFKKWNAPTIKIRQDKSFVNISEKGTVP